MSDQAQDIAQILIVEDNDINAAVLNHFLLPYGLIIKRLVNGKQAVDHVREHPVTLIMMDINMPVMNGCEATKNIRALENINQPAIVAVTADATFATEKACKEVGMNDFLAKPYNAQQLTMIVDKILKN